MTVTAAFTVTLFMSFFAVITSFFGNDDSDKNQTTELPLCDVVKNTGDVVKNTGDAVKNNGDVVKNNGDVVKNTGDVVKINGDAVKNTGDAVKNNGIAKAVSSNHLNSILKGQCGRSQLFFMLNPNLIEQSVYAKCRHLDKI